MNLQRIFALIKKDVKKTFREPALLFLIILFPLVLTLAFGLAFGAIGTSEMTYNLAVINNDGTYKPWAGPLVGNLSGSEMLNTLDYTSNAMAQKDLAEGKIDAIIIIPLNFSESSDSFLNNPTNESA
ncbi:MAG: ABC transporter permease, partial [Candidatus Hodarchaeota archaeon]